MKYLTIVRIVINIDNEILRPPILETGEVPQTSKWIRSKILVNIDLLVLKGKASCFPNSHETQSKFFVDIEPNKPLEANSWTWEEDVWPSWACHKRRNRRNSNNRIRSNKWKTKVVHGKHTPNSRTGPKFLSRPRILHNTPRIIKYNAITHCPQILHNKPKIIKYNAITQLS